MNRKTPFASVGHAQRGRDGESDCDEHHVAGARNARGPEDLRRRGQRFGGQHGGQYKRRQRRIQDELRELLVEVLVHEVQPLGGVTCRAHGEQDDHLHEYVGELRDQRGFPLNRFGFGAAARRAFPVYTVNGSRGAERLAASPFHRFSACADRDIPCTSSLIRPAWQSGAPLLLSCQHTCRPRTSPLSREAAGRTAR